MATITKVKLKDGTVRYRVRVVTGHRPDGTAVQAMRSFRTSKEAEAAGRAWETDIARGIRMEPGKLRTGEYLQQWLKRAERRLRPTTLHSYRYHLERFILPALAGIALRDLSPATLRAWLDALGTADREHRCRAILHGALEEACALELLARNPLERVKARASTASVATSWTAEEARAFLAAAAGHPFQPYWTLACSLPVRPSEVLGLRWSTVDLDRGTLAIVEARAIWAGQAFPGAPKSDAGTRTFELPPELVAVLRAEKWRQNARRLKKGLEWYREPGTGPNDGFVCDAGAGEPIPHRRLTRHFKALIAAAGVRDIRLYDLRHTAISLMAEAGADFKAISELAGHAGVRITRDVYQHTNRAQRAAALAALGRVLSAPPAAKEG